MPDGSIMSTYTETDTQIEWTYPPSASLSSPIDIDEYKPFTITQTRWFGTFIDYHCY